jgi:hypothetical protein
MINENHWQALAEQLGLEPEKPADEPLPTRDSPPAPRVEEERPRAEPEPEDISQPASEEEIGFALRPEAIEAAGEAESLPRPGEEEPEESSGPERRGRRHRRGGRSRSGKENAPAEAAEPAEGVADASGQEERPPAAEGKAPRGRGRRRGRGGRGEPGKLSGRGEERVVEEEESPAEEVPAAEEEVDDLSDWQAPSWQELIASLYRPDR